MDNGQPRGTQPSGGSKRKPLWSEVSLDLNFDSRLQNVLFVATALKLKQVYKFGFSLKFYPISAENFAFNEPVQIPVPVTSHQLLRSFMQMYTCRTLVGSIYNWMLLLST